MKSGVGANSKLSGLEMEPEDSKNKPTKTMETEIIQALSNVNINSETAEVLMREYLRYRYIKMAVAMTFVAPTLWVLCYIGWRMVKSEL